MKSKIKISELKVEAVVPNLDLFTKDKEKQKQISTLLPELVQENISFVLDNTNTATANAIRRGVLSEISWKVMCVDPTSVVTNEPFLKVHEFCKRLAFIPIMQDIPTGTTFSISVRNTNMTENRMIVHSDAIKVDNSSGSANSKTAKALFDSTYRIAELHPGNYLKVDGITIREGYSFMIDEPDGANAKFCPVANVQYAVLDYTPVYVLNNKQQFTSTYMRTSDLIKLDSGLKTLWSKSRIDFHNSKIAIMEDGSYAKGLEGLDLQKYNHVEYKIVVPKLPDMIQSTEVQPESYYLKVRTLGNIDPKELIRRVANTLIERLQRIDASLALIVGGEYQNLNSLNDYVDPAQIIDIISGQTTQIKIAGEKHTIANMLVTNILSLDPNIDLVNYEEVHVQENSFVLRLIHPEPIKITRDAITKTILDLSVIASL